MTKRKARIVVWDDKIEGDSAGCYGWHLEDAEGRRIAICQTCEDTLEDGRASAEKAQRAMADAEIVVEETDD